MSTSNMTPSLKYSLRCCCFHTDNVDVNISDGGNNSSDHHKDHNSYQALENRKPELGVLRKKSVNNYLYCQWSYINIICKSCESHSSYLGENDILKYDT